MKERISRRTALAGLSAIAVPGCQQTLKIPTDNIKSSESWNSIPALPFAVQEIYPCHYAQRIHMAGGFISRLGKITGPTAQHVSWAPEELHWRTEPELPQARHHPHMVNFKQELLVFGGFSAPGLRKVWTMQASGWRLRDGEWVDIISLPHPMGEAVTSVINDTLHIAGGRAPKGTANGAYSDHTDTAEHYVLAESSGIWETAAPCLTPRNSAAGAVVDHYWHIVGGRQVTGGNLTTHEVYDPKEDRWRNAAPMPQAQAGLAAAEWGGKLYAFGGEFFNNGGGVYPQCWVYDPQTDRWNALPDMTVPRHGLGAVTLGDYIYVIGGATEYSGNGTTHYVSRFDPGSV